MAKEKSASDVSKMIKDRDVKLVDFKFTDLLTDRAFAAGA